MANDKHPVPLHYKGVMVSSTFTDLKAHRAAIIKAIDAQELKSVVTENDAAKPGIEGVVMADFCRRALAYIIGQPLENFYRKKTLELGEQLLHHLRTHPWLFILDGLERVLVAYHRIDLDPTSVAQKTVYEDGPGRSSLKSCLRSLEAWLYERGSRRRRLRRKGRSSDEALGKAVAQLLNGVRN